MKFKFLLKKLICFPLVLIFYFYQGLAFAYWEKSELHNDYASAKSEGLSSSYYYLDINQFKAQFSDLDIQNHIEILIPRIDGSISTFAVKKTQVFESELAQRYPDFKTYKIQNINDHNERGRMEIINDQLSIVIKTPEGKELLNPINENQHYQVRKRQNSINNNFSCGNLSLSSNDMYLSDAQRNQINNQIDPEQRADVNSLTQLRLAIATTTEYSAQFGSTKAAVLAELARAVNRVNDIFEGDLAITLLLVSNNEDIIFLNSDNFTNNNAFNLIDEVQSVIDNAIGNSNYDVGHVFSTGGGGLATLRSVCRNSIKAQGVTGISNPTGDTFYVDYVAHELGHQLGAEHTYNGSSSSCTTREALSAAEPGSGSTVMAYAGICGTENLQPNSDANFHTTSIAEIDETFRRLFSPSCGTNVTNSSIFGTSNSASPVITDIAEHFIPVKTPFAITAQASDANSDTLYYQWDGKDIGTQTTSATIGCDLGDNALFRSNLAETQNTRYFPSIETLLDGFSHVGETLPTTGRQLNFTLKVTDNFGGIDTDDFKLTSVSSIGEFKVTSQSTSQSYEANEAITVTWDVANTTNSPVSCSAVDVYLVNLNADESRYCKQLILDNELNDGSALMTLPNETSANSRIIVQCDSNVFFAMNNANITVNNGSTIASNSCLTSSGGVQISNSSRVSSSLSCPSVADNFVSALVTLTGPTAVNEGETTTNYTVTLDQTIPAGGNGVVVNLTYSGVATNGTDFTGVSAVTVAAGTNSASFAIATLNDALSEGSESFEVNISSITDTDSVFDVIAEDGQQSITTTITDQTTAVNALVTLTGPTVVNEGETTTNYTVTLDQTIPAGGNGVVVNLTYSGVATDSTDFTGVSAVTVAAGTNSSSFTIATLNDALSEGSESFEVAISSISDTDSVFNVIAEDGEQSITTTITDQTTAVNALVTLTGPTTVIEGETTTNYSVALDQTIPSGGNGVAVNFTYSGAATDGTDFTGVSTATIAAGSSSTNFTIATIDDAFSEVTESFVVSVFGVTDTDNVFDSIVEDGQQSVTTSITDQTGSDAIAASEDKVLVTLSGPSTIIVGSSNAAYSVTLDKAIPAGGNGVVVHFTYKILAADNTETTGSYSVTVLAGSNSASSTTTEIDTVDDAIANGAVSFEISIDSITDTDAVFEAIEEDGIQSVSTAITAQTGSDSSNSSSGGGSFSFGFIGLLSLFGVTIRRFKNFLVIT